MSNHNESLSGSKAETEATKNPISSPSVNWTACRGLTIGGLFEVLGTGTI